MTRATLISGLLISITLSSSPSLAGPLGEHPAIIARRVHAAQGYDYASKFYPHPAWLYLRGQPSDGDAMATTERRPQHAGAAAEHSPLSQAQLERARVERP